MIHEPIRENITENIFQCQIMLNNAIYAQISWIKFLIKIMDIFRDTHTNTRIHHVQSMPNIISMIYNIEVMRWIQGDVHAWFYENGVLNLYLHVVHCPLGQNAIKLPFWGTQRARLSQQQTAKKREREREYGLRVQLCFVNIFHLAMTSMKILWKHLLSITPLHDTLTFSLVATFDPLPFVQFTSSFRFVSLM